MAHPMKLKFFGQIGLASERKPPLGPLQQSKRHLMQTSSVEHQRRLWVSAANQP
jgi:hypothetical protein